MLNRVMGRIAAPLKLAKGDQQIARLYAQGALKKRIKRYLRRWLGWAGTLVALTAGMTGIACDREHSSMRRISVEEASEYNRMVEWCFAEYWERVKENCSEVERIWNNRCVIGPDTHRAGVEAVRLVKGCEFWKGEHLALPLNDKALDDRWRQRSDGTVVDLTGEFRPLSRIPRSVGVLRRWETGEPPGGE